MTWAGERSECVEKRKTVVLLCFFQIVERKPLTVKILNFGSLNLDYVYQVPRFLQPGETMAATKVDVVPGGKGLNQSIALARAGASVWHAGNVGAGGEMLTEFLAENDVDDTYVVRSSHVQGNAIIQVTPEGENAILLCGGSNREITQEQVRQTIASFQQGDWLVLQNEVSCLKEMIYEGKKQGMKIVFNPSPFEEQLNALDFGLVDWLFINEVEGCQMTDSDETDTILQRLRTRYPHMNIVLTIGSQGAVCDTPEKRVIQNAYPVTAVDTTAAGDTFTGFFVAAYADGSPLEECMKRAAAAAAISVSRHGAAISIPQAIEVEEMLRRVDRR